MNALKERELELRGELEGVEGCVRNLDAGADW